MDPAGKRLILSSFFDFFSLLLLFPDIVRTNFAFYLTILLKMFCSLPPISSNSAPWALHFLMMPASYFNTSCFLLSLKFMMPSSPSINVNMLSSLSHMISVTFSQSLFSTLLALIRKFTLINYTTNFIMSSPTALVQNLPHWLLLVCLPSHTPNISFNFSVLDLSLPLHLLAVTDRLTLLIPLTSPSQNIPDLSIIHALIPALDGLFSEIYHLPRRY